MNQQLDQLMQEHASLLPPAGQQEELPPKHNNNHPNKEKRTPCLKKRTLYLTKEDVKKLIAQASNGSTSVPNSHLYTRRSAGGQYALLPSLVFKCLDG